MGLTVGSTLRKIGVAGRSPPVELMRFFPRFRDATVMILLATWPVVADEPDSHEHSTVTFNARPIIERLDLALSRPRRIAVHPDGRLLIADRKAGAVFEIFPDGTAGVICEGLQGPSGLAIDKGGLLFVSEYASGQTGKGTVLRIDTRGRQEVFATGLTGPTDLGVDTSGQLFVAEFKRDRILRFDGLGVQTITSEHVQAPSCVLVDEQDRVYTAGSAGSVLVLDDRGHFEVVCDGLRSPSDLSLNESGQLVAIDFGDSSMKRVDTLTRRPETLAILPEGTIASAFDLEGNAVVLNWELRSATRIRNHMHIKCPHCGGKIPVLLKPTREPVF